MLTQIIKNRFQHVLAQITRDIFFSMKGQGQKRCVLTQIKINRLENVLAQITNDIDL